MVVRVLIFSLCLVLTHATVWNLSCDQIRELVDGHNTRRLLVARGQVPGQPSAAKMTSLVWDEELAAKASKWAAHHRFAHNPDRTLPSKRFKSGENLFVMSTTQANFNFKLEEALESWFAEHKQYRFKPMSSADHKGAPIGHYTQMIWANTIHIGCGVAKFREGSWHKFLVVCNYGPAGNILTQKPYVSGKPSNSLVCGERNCSHPYGSKCATNRRKTVFLNKL